MGNIYYIHQEPKQPGFFYSQFIAIYSSIQQKLSLVNEDIGLFLQTGSEDYRLFAIQNLEALAELFQGLWGFLSSVEIRQVSTISPISLNLKLALVDVTHPERYLFPAMGFIATAEQAEFLYDNSYNRLQQIVEQVIAVAEGFNVSLAATGL